MSSKVRYDRISSLKEVRAERLRIHRELKATRQKLASDYENLTEVFTAGFWTGLAQKKFSAFLPATSWMTLGYEFFCSLMKGRRKCKKRKKKKKDRALLAEISSPQ